MSAMKDLEIEQMLSQPGTDTRLVKRWDVYDIADELADVPGVLQRLVAAPFPWNSFRDDILGAIADLKGLERRLWAAAERGGNVGPSPDYLGTP